MNWEQVNNDVYKPQLTGILEILNEVINEELYLGLLTYYGKFLPNLSTHLAPLY